MTRALDNVRALMSIGRSRSPAIPSIIAVLAALILVAAGARAAEGPWQRNDQSALRLITPCETSTGEGEFWFGVEFELAPHWHVYWENSGDAGYPPALDLAATPEVTGAELLFPAPERFHLPGDLLAFGYEDSVVYPVRAEIDAPLAEGPGEVLELAVNVDYVVCEVECIPYNYDLTLIQPLAEAAVEDTTQGARIAEWRSRLPTPGPDLAAEIAIEGEEPGRLQVDLPFAASDLFFVPQDLLILGEPSILPTESGSRAELSVSRLDVGKALPASLEFGWTATAAPDSEAFPGQSGLLAVTTPAVWRGADSSPEAVNAPAAGSGVLWWYWLPVVLAAVCFLASGALTAAPHLLRTAWIGGIFLVGAGWYLISRQGDAGALVSMPVVAIGAWILTLFAVLAFAGRTAAGAVAMGAVAAALTFSMLPAAPGIGWVGAALLLLAIIAARPLRESPSSVLLGVAGFLAMLAVVARFYLLSGSMPPTPLAGIQIGLLGSASGAWVAARGQKAWSRSVGWALVVAGAACVVYFVL